MQNLYGHLNVSDTWLRFLRSIILTEKQNDCVKHKKVMFEGTCSWQSDCIRRVSDQDRESRKSHPFPPPPPPPPPQKKTKKRQFLQGVLTRRKNPTETVGR